MNSPVRRPLVGACRLELHQASSKEASDARAAGCGYVLLRTCASTEANFAEKTAAQKCGTAVAVGLQALQDAGRSTPSCSEPRKKVRTTTLTTNRESVKLTVGVVLICDSLG